MLKKICKNFIRRFAKLSPHHTVYPVPHNRQFVPKIQFDTEMIVKDPIPKSNSLRIVSKININTRCRDMNLCKIDKIIQFENNDVRKAMNIEMPVYQVDVLYKTKTRMDEYTQELIAERNLLKKSFKIHSLAIVQYLKSHLSPQWIDKINPETAEIYGPNDDIYTFVETSKVFEKFRDIRRVKCCRCLYDADGNPNIYIGTILFIL